MLFTRELADLVDHFRSHRLISDYFGPLRPGKEAQIHCCRRPDGGFAILKLYTAIAERGFRADVDYGAGTGYVETRQLKLRRSASRKGHACRLSLWTASEVRNATRLRELGLPVPEMLGCMGSAVLMRMIGGPDRPARQLREAPPDSATATTVAARLQDDIRTMLAHGLIHGDLSAYNVLWHRGRHWLIDVPQMVQAGINANGRMLFMRDCARLLGFLRRCGAPVDPQAWAETTWTEWERGSLAP